MGIRKGEGSGDKYPTCRSCIFACVSVCVGLLDWQSGADRHGRWSAIIVSLACLAPSGLKMNKLVKLHFSGGIYTLEKLPPTQ